MKESVTESSPLAYIETGSKENLESNIGKKVTLYLYPEMTPGIKNAGRKISMGIFLKIC